jgi:hypothetical protein
MSDRLQVTAIRSQYSYANTNGYLMKQPLPLLTDVIMSAITLIRSILRKLSSKNYPQVGQLLYCKKQKLFQGISLQYKATPKF